MCQRRFRSSCKVHSRCPCPLLSMSETVKLMPSSSPVKPSVAWGVLKPTKVVQHSRLAVQQTNVCNSTFIVPYIESCSTLGCPSA